MKSPLALLAILAMFCVPGLADEIPVDEEPAQSDVLKQILQADEVEDEGIAASGFRNAFVTLAVTPRYPKKALKRGIDGEVTMEFEIAKHGRAENIRIVDEQPAKTFGEEAVDALKYWAFSPARLALCGTSKQDGRITIYFDHDADPQFRFSALTINNVPQAPQESVETTLQAFRQDQAIAVQASYGSNPRDFVPTNRVEPEFPTQALERRKEGMVALIFIVGVDGEVSGVEVVDTVNGTYFQRPSLRAIRQWTFKPKMRKGRYVESVACHEFIYHADEYKRSGKLSRQREERSIRIYTP